jgi:hypothetical protein
MKLYAYFSHKFIFILCSLILFLVLCSLFFPYILIGIIVTDISFAGPEYTIDHYGNIEYIGKDSYGHYHQSAPTQYKPYRPLGTIYNRAELDGIANQVFELQGSISRYFPLCELDSMSIEGPSPSTETFDRDIFDKRYQNLEKFIMDFPVDEESSTLEKLSLGYETLNSNVTFI